MRRGDRPMIPVSLSPLIARLDLPQPTTTARSWSWVGGRSTPTAPVATVTAGPIPAAGPQRERRPSRWRAPTGYVARTWAGASSAGSIRAALLVAYRPGDVAHVDAHKVRVDQALVLARFDPVAPIRAGWMASANLWAADLRDADLRDADLRGANPTSANLRDADLRGANLQGAYLGGADLRAPTSGRRPPGRQPPGRRPPGRHLRGADLRAPTLRAYLRDASLGGAYLGPPTSGTPDLWGALPPGRRPLGRRPPGAPTSGAPTSGAPTSGAADLRGADLRGANLPRRRPPGRQPPGRRPPGRQPPAPPQTGSPFGLTGSTRQRKGDRPMNPQRWAAMQTAANRRDAHDWIVVVGWAAVITVAIFLALAAVAGVVRRDVRAVAVVPMAGGPPATTVDQARRTGQWR